jgi:hypothetical protein
LKHAWRRKIKGGRTDSAASSSFSSSRAVFFFYSTAIDHEQK